jgi:hypothetical protein
MSETSDKLENKAREWTVDQLAFQRWLSLPSICREPGSRVKLAKALGVDRRSLHRWTQLPGWGEAVGALVKSTVFQSPAVQRRVLGSLIQEAEQGSFNHQRLYLEVAGIYNPKAAPAASVTILYGVEPEDV